MEHLNRNALYLSAHGGVLTLMAEAGEIIAEVGIPSGRVPAAPYLDMLPEGGYIEVSEGITAFEPPSAVGIARNDGQHFDTGANPDFQPTSASRNEKEMRVMLRRMHMATTKIEAKARALDQVERIPTNVEDEQVIEDEIPENPAPKPKAKAKAPEKEAEAE